MAESAASADPAAPEPRRVFLATPSFEAALVDELPAAWRPRAFPTSPGLVISDERPGGGPPLDPVFARQQLPRARPIEAPSVASLAEACYAAIEASIDAAGGPFTVHRVVLTGADPRLASRCELVAEETVSLLRQRRKRAARGFRLASDASRSLDELRLVVQILLTDRGHGFVSCAAPRGLATGGWELAPWPGGVAPVPDDRRPPSRAYRKLEEAFLWMNEQPRPGELCVDLGAAPGGWTYGALARGADVIAVDRAPLAAPVREHPRLTAIAGNALAYLPPRRADWLLSDIICEPARAHALIAAWVERGQCRHLVVTVKFKGRDGYGMLDELRALFARAGWPRVRIKHLHHNKNEVTVMASATGFAAPPPPAASVPGSIGAGHRPGN